MVDFWKEKKVFITGHTGFKGSWLSLWLQLLQSEVVGYALSPPTPLNLFTEANVAREMIDLRGDIRDYNQLSEAINFHQPDIIFHLAAQPLVRYSYAHPLETYSTNVMGTVHLLEAARHCSSVKTIVNVTTDKCYENQEKHDSYQEQDPMGGFDPYSSSKGCSELITSAYRNSYFNDQVGLASARAGNVIGGGDWAEDRLVPDLIHAGMNNLPLKIRYPQAIRPWQHVLDSLSGYLKLAEALYLAPTKFKGAWNFGPYDTNSKSVEWVTQKIINLFGKNLTWEIIKESQLHEASLLTLDCSKAHSILGWKPKWDINQTLHTTVAWYQAYYNGQNAQVLTHEQINQYMTPAEELFNEQC